MNGLPSSLKNRYRFPHRARLNTAKQFRDVFRGSLVSQDRNYRVKAIANNMDFARLGLAVSRRVDKRAVGRNRIKRLVRESFRTNKEMLTGLDIVVVARQAASRTDEKQLTAAIDQHWRKLAESAKKGGV